MKKISLLCGIIVSLLYSGSPVHDKMDSRIKGKSFGGTLNDNSAAEDGLGIIPLQHYSGTRDINNELITQKVFNKIIYSSNDINLTSNVKNSIENNLLGSQSDQNIVTNFFTNNPIDNGIYKGTNYSFAPIVWTTPEDYCIGGTVADLSTTKPLQQNAGNWGTQDTAVIFGETWYWKGDNTKFIPSKTSIIDSSGRNLIFQTTLFAGRADYNTREMDIRGYRIKCSCPGTKDIFGQCK